MESEWEIQAWSENKAHLFACIYLLYQIKEGIQISVILDRDYQFLEPLLDRLHSKNYIKIENAFYQLCQDGKEFLQRFHNRYREYLRVYDIFSAVDLNTGEFAFAKYFDFDTDDAWYNYLENERWVDLRIAVARLKKLDVHEIVFMNFLNEGLFGAGENGWQFDLILGSIWDEIRNICRDAITAKELGGESRLIEWVRQGSELMIELLEHEQKLKQWERENQEQGRNLEPDEEEEDVWDIEELYAYRDPFYVSPFWAVPLLFF